MWNTLTDADAVSKCGDALLVCHPVTHKAPGVNHRILRCPKSLFPCEFWSHQAQNLKYTLAWTQQGENWLKKRLQCLPLRKIFRKATLFEGHLDNLIWSSCFHLTGTVFCICMPESLTIHADRWHSSVKHRSMTCSTSVELVRNDNEQCHR